MSSAKKCISVRWLMILVAIAAVNLTGIISGLKLRNNQTIDSMHMITYLYKSDDSIEMINEFQPSTRPIMLKYPSVVGSLRVWWPMAISAGATVLMIRSAMRLSKST